MKSLHAAAVLARAVLLAGCEIRTAGVPASHPATQTATRAAAPSPAPTAPTLTARQACKDLEAPAASAGPGGWAKITADAALMTEVEGVTSRLGTDFTSWTAHGGTSPYLSYFAKRIARDCERAGAPLTPAALAGLNPPPPPVTVTYTSQYLAYAVTGTGPADITYGTDSINDSPPGSGSLGGGTTVPWSGSLPYGPNQNALYFVVNAQLQGSGDISCSVSLVTATHYSNGTKHVSSQVLATGSASGGYNICTAEDVND